MTDTGRLLDEGWIDISVPLRPGIAIFEGDPTFHLARAFSIEGGAVCNVSRVDMGVHTGTHLDAPVHFIDGAPASESIPLEAGMGPAWVVDATGVDGRGDHRGRAGGPGDPGRRDAAAVQDAELRALERGRLLVVVRGPRRAARRRSWRGAASGSSGSTT